MNYKRISDISEENIADIFIKTYNLPIPITTEHLVNIFSDEIVFTKEQFDQATHGLMMIIEGLRPCIAYDPTSRPPSYTILHEIREVLQVYFERLSPNYFVNKIDKERRCEKFAAYTLMPSFEFGFMATRLHGNIEELAKFFKCSYSAILIRLNEVLGWEFQLIEENGEIILESSNYKKCGRLRDSLKVTQIMTNGSRINMAVLS